MVVAIYNVFDGEELLEGSIKSVRPWVDLVIAVCQEYSNFGEYYDGGLKECERLYDLRAIDHIHYYNPKHGQSALACETEKRNLGIKIAKSKGASHLIHLDCDEYWIEKPGIDTAHEMITYFKTPELIYEPRESYYVPGIISIRKDTKVGAFNCGFYCDPTRTPNHLLSKGSAVMHHFSYVRKNIDRKINNSTARSNILAKKDQLLTDLENARDGYKMTFNEKSLKLVDNLFGIQV